MDKTKDDAPTKVVRRNWVPEEDLCLKQIVKSLDPDPRRIKWAEVSRRMAPRFNRKGKQCRERWYNHLNPDINKGEWTLDEDIMIFEQQQKKGNQWTAIARLLPNRSADDVKNRFHSSFARRRVNKSIASSGVSSSLNPVKDHYETVQPPVISASPKPPPHNPADGYTLVYVPNNPETRRIVESLGGYPHPSGPVPASYFPMPPPHARLPEPGATLYPPAMEYGGDMGKKRKHPGPAPYDPRPSRSRVLYPGTDGEGIEAMDGGGHVSGHGPGPAMGHGVGVGTTTEMPSELGEPVSSGGGGGGGGDAASQPRGRNGFGGSGPPVPPMPPVWYGMNPMNPMAHPMFPMGHRSAPYMPMFMYPPHPTTTMAPASAGTASSTSS